MKVYLSGPMSGIPAFNIPMFDEYAAALRFLGHEVVSPAELDDPAFRVLCLKCVRGDSDELGRLCDEAGLKNDSWGDLLARDVKLLADDGIEGIVVIDGWKRSRGALLETFVGRLCGLPIYRLGNKGSLLPVPAGVVECTHKEAAGCLNAVNVNAERPTDELLYVSGQAVLPPMMRDRYVATPECIHKQGTNLGLDAREYFEKAVEKEQGTEIRASEAIEAGVLDPNEWVPFSPEARAEAREVRVTSETGGQKGEKLAVIGDICPKSLKLLAEVAGFGRKKYDRLNYLKGFEYSLAYDAAQRHLNEFWAGNETDEESHLPHLAHAAWQCLCLLAFQLRKIGKDDRP